MSQNLEEVFRSVLKDQEVPFDPKAWESMSARLDEVMPVQPKGGSNSLWIAASVAAVVGIGTWAYFGSSEGSTQNTKTNDKVVVQQPTRTTIDEEKTIEQSNSKTEVEKLADNNSPAFQSEAPNKAIENDPVSPIKVQDDKTSTPIKPIYPEDPIKTATPGVSKYTPTEAYPALGTLCQFESENVKNPFKLPLTFSSPSGKNQTIEAEGQKKIKFDESGEYLVSVGEKKPTKIKVNAKPVFDFEAVRQSSDNGVPTYDMSVTGEITNPIWKVKETGITYRGENVQMHLFNKGYIEIELSGENASGCETVVNRKVFVEEQYILRADNNALYPYDQNSSARTFLPPALTLRDTPFTMIIMDPRNGDIVFTTNDPSNPWDGRHKNTGQMVDMDVVNYRWVVTLEKPLKGEKTKYSGEVIVSSKRR